MIEIDVSRYTDSKELVFDVEFVTPAFLGGADGNAEIRTAPFKTGIRYWWRILYGSKYNELNKLKLTEDTIFGSTKQKSTVDIVINNCIENYTDNYGFPNGKRISVVSRGREIKINILDYLAYGKYKYERGHGNVYTNTYIKPNTKFKIKIIICNPTHQEEILDAVKMFVLYGGIGSRSRNGFGSMYADLSSVKFSKKIVVSSVLKEEFPAFSEKSRFFKTKDLSNTWEEALSEVGEIYRSARCNLEKHHCYESRGYVSRPIEVGNENIPKNIKQDRIPKPFYLGVKKENNQYSGYIICIPIVFYEKDSQDDYMKVYGKMTKFFSEKLEDNTNQFFESFTGASK